jgi:type I restriction enzyme S subunit
MKVSVITDTEDHLSQDAVRNLPLVPADSVLIVVRSGILQRTIPVAINAVPVTLNQDMKALLPGPALSARFLAFLIEGSTRRFLTEWCKTGATVESIEQEFLANSEILLPPRVEQDAIVAFLDRKLEQVDRFIAAKQRLITLLQEQKTALINRAVTKGLNPDAPMKNSGIDWLGEIPAHWEVKTNGKLFRQRVEKGIEGLPLLEVSLNTGVSLENGSADRKKWTIAEAEKYKLARKGDIAFNMMRMWQGAVGVVPVDGLTSPAYIVAVPYDGMNSDYYSLLFRTDDYKTEINRYSKGIVSDRNRLYWDSFKQMASLCPPPEEQESILDYVAAESCKIDGGIRTAEREIELIQEFRTTLISEAVRGTISLGRESNA